MNKRKHLIVGCGTAALAAVDQIARWAPDDRIVVTTAESTPPYSPTALPYLLSGRVGTEELWMRPDDFFDGGRITLLLDKRLAAVDPAQRRVSFMDGTAEEYDTLLLAMGSVPILPPIRGLAGELFMGFRSLSDCRRLLSQIDGDATIGVLGAGLVGLEVAIGLLERRRRVTVLEREPTLLPLYFDAEAGGLFRQAFEGAGAILETGRQVVEVSRTERGVSLICADGFEALCHVLVTAVGMQPNTAPLIDSGLALNRGVLVDRGMRTNQPAVWCAGDLAEAPGFFDGGLASNPILPSAAEQGRVAGAGMVGREIPYDGWINMNVFNFFGNSAVSIGLSSEPGDDGAVLSFSNPAGREYKRLIFDRGCLVGGAFVNVPVDPGVILYLIRNRLNLRGREENLFAHPREVARALMLDAERATSTSRED